MFFGKVGIIYIRSGLPKFLIRATGLAYLWLYRLGLIGKKHWRQFLKTLTIVEFLLFHGPEQTLMEFGSDRDVIEDLTRFNYVDERGYDA